MNSKYINTYDDKLMKKKNVNDKKQNI